MSYIPNIREIIKKPLTSLGKEEENGYYQGYLDDQRAEFLAGYDYAVEEIFTNFFYNLDVYLDRLDECGFDDVRLDKFSKVFEDFQENEEFDIENVQDTSVRLLLTLIECFQDWAEMERDEVGVSLIESMSDEEYEECVEKYKAGYKNTLVKREEPKE